MPYILSMMICIYMIMLDNLLQCLICIVRIDLSSTCDCISIFICKSLVVFMSYFWIKIKLKVLLCTTSYIVGKPDNIDTEWFRKIKMCNQLVAAPKMVNNWEGNWFIRLCKLQCTRKCRKKIWCSLVVQQRPCNPAQMEYT
jgi:hypothetical protein